MREKELRIALICYGGISLAVYMHGITKEVWRLAKASRDFHDGDPPGSGSLGVYHDLLARIAGDKEIRLRVLVDILAGASAGGINAIFLSHAIASGRSLDPLTALWLDSADVDKLIDPAVNRVSRFAKAAAVPFAWAISSRSGTIDKTVEPAHRAEIRAKLANFVRARWFAPPFGGPGFTHLLLDAFDAMEREPAGRPLLPDNQPLDLYVTVTDFRGYPERLRLNSPPEVVEREHRVTLAFLDPGSEHDFADPIELTFAARATASFPGAFPPFMISELDQVLEQRGKPWPGRAAFLARALPRQTVLGDAENAVLIDGSVLANAPFGPCIAALEKRPARREIDRRFVYIDPKPGMKSVRLTGGPESEPPGFIATILGALSDIPREQPIRDNLEAIERLSSRVRRLRRIVATMQPEVEAAIERAVGSTFFLVRPNPKRLAAWRSRANDLAARSAGYAYSAYAHLKIATVVEDAAEYIFRLGGGGDRGRKEDVRQAIWAHVRAERLTDADAVTARNVRPDVIAFLRDFDRGFRTRRLRFVVRRVGELVAEREDAERIRRLFNDNLTLYHEREPTQPATEGRNFFEDVIANPAEAMAALAALLDLRPLDEETDARLTEAMSTLPKPDRRRLILAYLGYPFYDVATLPLLQGEGLDEFDPIKVDRISPDDAVAIRQGGTSATLKGIQFNSFGAFFSRAYRENDYLWGRLHGAERMIDIILSVLPEKQRMTPEEIKVIKRHAFRAILAEEQGRLNSIPNLFRGLRREIG